MFNYFCDEKRARPTNYFLKPSLHAFVMEPTPAEVANFHTVEDLAIWAGMKGEIDNPKSTVGSFFKFMGFAPEEHWRTMAIIADSDLQDILKNWNMGNANGIIKASPGQLAQARLIGFAARITGGMQHRICKKYVSEKGKTIGDVVTQAISDSDIPKRTIAMSEKVNTMCKDESPLLAEYNAPSTSYEPAKVTSVKDLQIEQTNVWKDIISTARLCSPSKPVFREGRTWLSCPLRFDTDVECSNCDYFYNGFWKNSHESVIGYHNTRLESLIRATPLWSGMQIGSGILVDGRLRYGCCTHNGCSGVNIYSDGGYETFAGSQGWVQLEVRCANTKKLQGGRPNRYCIRGTNGEVCDKATLLALWVPYDEIPSRFALTSS